MCQNFNSSISKVLTEIKTRSSNRAKFEVSSSYGDDKDMVTNSKAVSRPFTVLVEGNIGSGKTTFLEHFNKFNEEVEIMLEPVERWRCLNGHNLLQMMYEDPSRWSLAFQTYVQLTMVQNHTKTSEKSVKLMERSLYSAKYCFVENLKKSGKMPLSEYEVLTSWFQFLLSCPQVDLGVDLIVYMRTDPDVALSRVKKRSRGEEHLIAEEYIRDLHYLHEDWLVHGCHGLPAPVLVVDADKDIGEMKEAFAKQEKVIFGRSRKKVIDDEDKENSSISSVGNKRRIDCEGGRRKKNVLVELKQNL